MILTLSNSDTYCNCLVSRCYRTVQHPIQDSIHQKFYESALELETNMENLNVIPCRELFYTDLKSRANGHLKNVNFWDWSFNFLFWRVVYFLNSIFVLSVLLVSYSISYNLQSHKSTIAAGPGELVYGKEASEWNTNLKLRFNSL